MNRNHLHHALRALVLLAAMISCVPPSQATQPTPALDPNTVGTAVAGTAQAAMQQTAAVQSPVAGMTGTTLEKLSDKTTKYSDYDAGFEIIFPAGWLALRPNSEEFTTALAKDAAVNSMLRDQMELDQAGYEADYDRIYAYILRPDIIKNSVLGFSKLVWNSKDALSLDNEAMGKIVRDLEAPGGIPGFHANTAKIHEDRDVKMIEIGGRWSMSDGQGGTIPFYTTIIFFKPSANSAARITFSFLEDQQGQIAVDINSIIESIRIITSQQ